jgi:SAM-dependent methyltransferase
MSDPFKEISWVHQIKLPDGRVTPGKWPSNEMQYGLTQISFTNKRVLDIGCADGAYSFYAEQNGAKEVVSIDINEEQFGRQTRKSVDWSRGYRYAHHALKSRAHFIFPYSAYDVNKSEFGIFDIVLCLGVIYHVAHPLLLLERINEVLKVGGILVLETEISESFTFFAHRMQKKNKEAIAARMHRRSMSEKIKQRIFSIVNSWLVGKEREIYKKDLSNHWIISREDMEKMIDFSGFACIKKEYPVINRATYIVKKVADFPTMYADRNHYKKIKKKTNSKLSV